MPHDSQNGDGAIGRITNPHGRKAARKDAALQQDDSPVLYCHQLWPSHKPAHVPEPTESCGGSSDTSSIIYLNPFQSNSQ